jgi:hypothetical protein
MERLMGLPIATQNHLPFHGSRSPARTARFPADLRRALPCGGIWTKPQRAIDRIRATDARLAGELEEWVRTYRYDRIVALCEGPQGSP